VLLLDEPFGALDAVVRRDLRRWLRQLHEQMNITTIFVTHDQEEAFDLADRVVIMHDGKIAQQGTPLDIYRNPENMFVHEFLGESNRIPCRVANKLIYADAGYKLGEAELADGPAIALIRPHQIIVNPARSGAWTVARIAMMGAQARVSVTENGATLEATLTADRLLKEGLETGASVKVLFCGGMISPVIDSASEHHAATASNLPTNLVPLWTALPLQVESE
jgi:sulfate transport system ATP-binding protein